MFLPNKSFILSCLHLKPSIDFPVLLGGKRPNPHQIQQVPCDLVLASVRPLVLHSPTVLFLPYVLLLYFFYNEMKQNHHPTQVLDHCQ